MKQSSFGIIPLKSVAKNQWEVLLIQHQAGHWSFPKGHSEKGEEPQQTAERELLEETGLQISQFLSDHPFIEKYWFMTKGIKIEKTVTYFLAIVKGEIKLQEEEIKHYMWVPLEKAEEYVSFKEAKRICHEAVTFLRNH